MTKAEKLLARMRANPRDWRIEDLETVARRHGVQVRKTGGSHFVFMHPDAEIAVTVPFKRPIKPVYVLKLISLLDEIGTEQ